MLRRFLLAIILIGCLPAVASATWYINATTSPSTGAGTITSPGTVAYPDTTLSVNYTVTPAVGYIISAVRDNGANMTAVSPGVYQVNKSSSMQYIVAYFAAKTYSVTMSVSAGGSIQPAFTSPSPTALPAGGNYTFNIVPNTGNMITNVQVDGVSVGAVSSYTFNAISANHTLYASFSTIPKVVAKVTPTSQDTTGLGAAYAVTLDASQSTTTVGSLAYLWTVTGTDPAGLTGGTFDNNTSVKPLFYADKVGTYTITLTANDGLGHSDQTTATVQAITRQAYLADYCASCHSGRDPQVIANYDASPHYTTTQAVPSCQYCHAPGQPENVNHYTVQFPYDSCQSCHTSFTPNTPGHIAKAGTSGCVNCHDAHSTSNAAFYQSTPHFNNATSGSYPASYVTSRITCANCHSITNDTMTAEQNRTAYYGSRHAATTDPAWTVNDFKTMNGCVRCHTTTGFVAYSSVRSSLAWGSASDKTKEVLACNGCHNADFTLRILKPYSSASFFVLQVDPSNTVSVSYKNSDYSSSNVCLRCHAATASGDLVKKVSWFANFTAVGRLLNHYQASGGILDNNAGYEFDGTPRGIDIDFNKQNTWHAGIGSPASLVDTGTGGACVVCHMSSPGQEHSFAAVFKNTTGSIVAIPPQPVVCANCHPSPLGGGPVMDVNAINSYKSGFAAALTVLKAELQAKGINPDAPAGTNWGADQVTRTNNMGAYYNYMLLENSDKAAYVHNPVYTKRLIQYSIDWLDNGLFDDSASMGIHAVAGPSLDTKNAATSYLGLDDTTTGNCINCHQAYYN